MSRPANSRRWTQVLRLLRHMEIHHADWYIAASLGCSTADANAAALRAVTWTVGLRWTRPSRGCAAPRHSCTARPALRCTTTCSSHRTNGRCGRDAFHRVQHPLANPPARPAYAESSRKPKLKLPRSLTNCLISTVMQMKMARGSAMGNHKVSTLERCRMLRRHCPFFS